MTGAARDLALAMNRVVLRNRELGAGGGSGLDAWQQLAKIEVPVTVGCGNLDVPFLVERCQELGD